MDKNTQITAAQFQQLLDSNNRSLITSGLLGLILVYMLSNVIPISNVAIWLLLLFASSIIRIVLAESYKKHPVLNEKILRRRFIAYRAGVMSSALVWGYSAFILYAESNTQYQLFLIFMLMGLSAGGTISYSVDLLSARIFTSLVIIPPLIRLFIQGDPLSIAMSTAGILYLVFIYVTIRQINHNFKDSITLRLEADARERAVKESEERYRLLLNHSPVGIMHYDTQLVITYCNQRLADILNTSTERLVNLDLKKLKDQSLLPSLHKALMGMSGSYEGPYVATFSDAGGWVNLTTASSRDSHGTIVGGIAIVQDVTVHKKATEAIEQLAFYDPLTKLPNRRLLLDRLNHALQDATRSGRRGALLFLDLDHFKTLNDTLGHYIGDTLLQQVADRLLRCVREGDTVARLGGDEYVVMLKDLHEHALEAAAHAEVVGYKIIHALNIPYRLGTHEYHSTPSIGVAMFGEHGDTEEELLKHADIAMYQAKKAGRNVIRFFDPEMQEVISARASLEIELRKAILDEQFELYYQLQVDQNHSPIGAEVLIRWMHPERGMVPPLDFIPLTEETGLIVPIGKWVLEAACRQLKQWQQDTRTRHLTLSVNVSAKQFHQPDFVEQVQEILLRNEVDSTKLKFELTESMLLAQMEMTVTTMQALRDIGIRFALDDFGTGYSSLQYLKQLPLYQLKIDQSFVRDISDHGSDITIVRTIIAMAQSLGLDVIAEGVETENQRQLLLNNGCENFQGYLFSRPVDIKQFELLIGLS